MQSRDKLCKCGHYLSDHIKSKGRGAIRGCMSCPCRSFRDKDKHFGES